eukprot:1151232-Pleurochrysis_carterae.AAC.4
MNEGSRRILVFEHMNRCDRAQVACFFSSVDCMQQYRSSTGNATARFNDNAEEWTQSPFVKMQEPQIRNTMPERLKWSEKCSCASLPALPSLLLHPLQLLMGKGRPPVENIAAPAPAADTDGIANKSDC